jgi:glycosyltransferase 2 family protein
VTVSQPARPVRISRPLRLAIQWLLPAVLIGLAALTGHLTDAARILVRADPGIALALVVVGVALPVVHAWRWRFLLLRAGDDLRLAPASEITAMASLLNYAAPGYLGAPAKAVLARQSHGVPISRSAPTLAAEQTLDALVLVVVGGLAAVVAGPAVVTAVLGNLTEATLIWSAIVVTGVTLIAAAGYIAVQRLRPEFVPALWRAARQVVMDRSNGWRIVAGTGGRWLLDMTAIWLAAYAVGMSFGLIDLLLIGNMSLLVGVLSPLPGGLGAREATMAVLGGVLGFMLPAILAMAVLHRASLALALPLVVVGSRLIAWRRR